MNCHLEAQYFVAKGGLIFTECFLPLILYPKLTEGVLRNSP